MSFQTVTKGNIRYKEISNEYCKNCKKRFGYICKEYSFLDLSCKKVVYCEERKLISNNS